MHIACYRGVADKVIMKLIEVGGQKLVMMRNYKGRTALHITYNMDYSFEVIMKLVEIGGSQLFTKVALQYYSRSETDEEMAEIDYSLAFMLREGVLAEAGGKLGVGGLFNIVEVSGTNNNDYYIGDDIDPRDFVLDTGYYYVADFIVEKVYVEWESLVAPSLEVALKLPSSLDKKPPLLQAAIIGKAPPNVINDIITRFDCTLTKDSLGRLPI